MPQFICPVCAESVDELGFKISLPEISEPAQELICVECRMKSMQSRANRSYKTVPRQRPSEMFSDDMPEYRPPYRDE
jgi:hypothetical protein